MTCDCGCQWCRRCERRATDRCPACEGKGTVWGHVSGDPYGNARWWTLDCVGCHGTGRVPAPTKGAGEGEASNADALAAADMAWEGCPHAD
jgi:hypothetical protein